MGDYGSCSRSSSSRGSRRLRGEPTDDAFTSLYASLKGLTAELQTLRATQTSWHRRLDILEREDNLAPSVRSLTPTDCLHSGHQCGTSCRQVMHKPLQTAVDSRQYAEQPLNFRVSLYPNDASPTVPTVPPPYQEKLRIQSFTGKEDWRVWLGKFSALTERFCYSQEDKLTELLQLFDGPAAEFVFMHLPSWMLHDFQALVYEVGMRFRVVKSTKAFAAEFARCEQQLNESLESYAAKLKSLHHKAYPHRDPQTRQEDLLQRFLDGLQDQEARVRVEFHKEPGTIDDAVYHLAVHKQLAADCRQTSPWRSLNTEGPLLVA